MNLVPIERENTPMMMNTTLEQLRGLKLNGMAAGLHDQLSSTGMNSLSFEECMALLVDREVNWRGDKRRERLIKQARLKYPQAAIEDLDTRSGRSIDRKSLMSLVLGDWIDSGHSVLITGPTGAGKSWLACALAQYACRRGHSALYQRVPRLGEELRIRHGNGTRSMSAVCCGAIRLSVFNGLWMVSPSWQRRTRLERPWPKRIALPESLK
jgi:DNA replication protein DnaC